MAQNQVEELLNARAEIDEQLRRHKNQLTVLFTDIVGSTGYFDRFGDTAGLAMVHLSTELGTTAVREFGGTLVKTIGDSVMADFPDATSAVRAATAMQRRLMEVNATLPDHRRMEVRIGIHSGMGFRKGSDVFGDVVNLAARITRRTGPAQILISRTVKEAIAGENNISCRWLDKCTIDGRSEKEDIFEVVWTDPATYTELRRKLETAHSDTHAESASEPKLPARYKILDKVGQGGAGIVYKARDLQTNEILALKVLKPEIASDAVAQANFNKELCLARKITHKNVCRIYDLYRSDGISYASMEYVEGENLLTILSREGKISVSKALEILGQLCGGLREAHAQGVVHRDLKPANIMVDQGGVVKIMDFGIARLMKTEVGQTAAIVGTPAYMSPEQAEGKSVDARTDIYAIGLIFYEMLTGSPAFGGDTAAAIAMKQVTEAPNSPRDLVPSIPKHVEALILKCLEKNPSKRFRSINEFAAALERTEQAAQLPVASSAKSTVTVSLDLKWLREIEEYFVSLEIEKRIEQVRLFLCKPSSGRLPQYVSMGNRRVETRHALILASLFVLAPFIAWTALSHSTKAPAPHTESLLSSNSRPGNNQESLGSKSTAAIPYTVSSVQVSSPPLGDLDSSPVGAESDAEDTGEIQPLPEPIQKRYKKPVTHSIAMSNKSQPSLKESAAIALPLSTTALPPSLASSPVAPTPGPISGSEASASIDSSKSATSAAADQYFDVGSFKDPKWADNAAETLGKLGFRTTSLHKGKLWMNSYHVIVGPYHDDETAELARQILESHGFKPRPAKID